MGYVFKLTLFVVPLFRYSFAIVLIYKEIPLKAMRCLVVDYWAIRRILSPY